MRLAITVFILISLLSSCRTDSKQSNLSNQEYASKVETDLTGKQSKYYTNNNDSSETLIAEEFETELIDTIGDCEKCVIKYISAVQRNLGNLQPEDLRLFLCTFSPTCERNVEFGEYSNEVLFELIESNTELFFRVLVAEIKSIHFEILLQELESPVHDGINIDNLITEVQKARTINPSIKEDVLNALNKAKDY